MACCTQQGSSNVEDTAWVSWEFEGQDEQESCTTENQARMSPRTVRLDSSREYACLFLQVHTPWAVSDGSLSRKEDKRMERNHVWGTGTQGYSNEYIFFHFGLHTKCKIKLEEFDTDVC